MRVRVDGPRSDTAAGQRARVGVGKGDGGLRVRDKGSHLVMASQPVWAR